MASWWSCWMKKANEIIKSSARFIRLLYSFSVLIVTPTPKKREGIFKMSFESDWIFDLPIWQKGLVVKKTKHNFNTHFSFHSKCKKKLLYAPLVLRLNKYRLTNSIFEIGALTYPITCKYSTSRSRRRCLKLSSSRTISAIREVHKVSWGKSAVSNSNGIPKFPRSQLASFFKHIF